MHFLISFWVILYTLFYYVLKTFLLSIFFPGGRVLAAFEENARNFLFPTPSCIPERNLVKRDILLTRTDNFPIAKVHNTS